MAKMPHVTFVEPQMEDSLIRAFVAQELDLRRPEARAEEDLVAMFGMDKREVRKTGVQFDVLRCPRVLAAQLVYTMARRLPKRPEVSIDGALRDCRDHVESADLGVGNEASGENAPSDSSVPTRTFIFAITIVLVD